MEMVCHWLETEASGPRRPCLGSGRGNPIYWERWAPRATAEVGARQLYCPGSKWQWGRARAGGPACKMTHRRGWTAFGNDKDLER